MRYPCVILLFVAAVIASEAGEIIIQSIDYNGEITFNEVPDAISYRIEWATEAGGMWTGFTSEAVACLDHIPGSGGTGTISVTVPIFYRVVATVPPEGMVLKWSPSFGQGIWFDCI